MISFNEMQQMLVSLLDELPEAFFEQLSGGVVLLDEAPMDDSVQDVYILGEYQQDPLSGCGIALYYGSFLELFGTLEKSELRKELRATLRHEFRHHLEALSGVDDLGREDEAELLQYQSEEAAQKSPAYAKQTAWQRGLQEGKACALQKKRHPFWAFWRKG